MKKSTVCLVSVIALSSIIAACDEELVTGPGFVCDVTNPVRDVFLDPTNATVLVRSPARPSDVIQLNAVVTNRLGGARTDVPVTFSSSDPTVATVDSAGLVHAVKPGTATIKASACGESATAQITIVGAVVTVQVIPAAPSAVSGDTVLVTARAIGQTGTALSDVKFTFTASPSSIATVKAVDDSTAQLITTGAGTVTVTATGEGTSGSAPVVVLAKAFLTAASSPGAIDAGGHMACGIITLGRAYCWGLNDLSQLGAATDSLCFRNTDTQTDTLELVVKRCSLVPKRLAPTVAFASISAGDSSACGVATNGRVYCWGNNSHGEIGDGSGALRGTATLISTGLSFSAVSVGGGHACGITVGGAAYCWGQDTKGQLGDARLINSTTPIPVSGGGGPAFLSAIAAGRTHTCGLAPDGTAFCWGSNTQGELGAGGSGGISDTPAAVAGGLHFTSISAGGDSALFPALQPARAFTCAIDTNAAAWCWGDNSVGQLGVGNLGLTTSSPENVVGGLSFTRISAGGSHACGLTTGGAVYCWGGNIDLQLGRGPFTGTDASSGVPMQVTGGELPAGVTFTSISAGATHTCGIGSDGFAYCWGSNIYGALGNTLQAAFRGLPQRVATPQ